MKKTKLSIIIFFLFGFFLSFSQTSEKKFTPNVIITLWSDSIIQLSDFELHGPHYRPDYYYNIEHKGKIDIPIKIGNIWFMKSFEEIDKIIFKFKENPSNSFGTAWLDSEIFLTSGDTLKGETPKKPSSMWESGEFIKIYSDVKVLGTVGKYELPIEKIKEIKKNGNEFILTTIEEEKKTLTNPYFAHYAYGRSFIFNNYSYSHKPFVFITEGLSVKLYQANLDSIVCYKDDKKVFIKMKDGNEAIGKFKDFTIYIKGNTENGSIWYQSVFGKEWYINEDGHKRSKTISNIKTINFL